MASQPYLRPRDTSHRAVQVETLLSRYPDITEQEIDKLVHAFARLPLLDFSLLTADARLGDKMNAFYADHGDRLRPTHAGVAAALAVPVLIVAVALISGALG